MEGLGKGPWPGLPSSLEGPRLRRKLLQLTVEIGDGRSDIIEFHEVVSQLPFSKHIQGWDHRSLDDVLTVASVWTKPGG